MKLWKIFYGGDWQTVVDAAHADEACEKWSKLMLVPVEEVTAEEYLNETQ